MGGQKRIRTGPLHNHPKSIYVSYVCISRTNNSLEKPSHYIINSSFKSGETEIDLSGLIIRQSTNQGVWEAEEFLRPIIIGTYIHT